MSKLSVCHTIYHLIGFARDHLGTHAPCNVTWRAHALQQQRRPQWQTPNQAKSVSRVRLQAQKYHDKLYQS